MDLYKRLFAVVQSYYSATEQAEITNLPSLAALDKAVSLHRGRDSRIETPVSATPAPVNGSVPATSAVSPMPVPVPQPAAAEDNGRAAAEKAAAASSDGAEIAATPAEQGEASAQL